MLQRFWRLAVVVAVVAACDTRVPGLVGVSAPATRIAFTVQPSDVAINIPIIPAVRVEVQNPQGQTIGSGIVDVVLTIVPGTGTAGAVLSGASVQSSINGLVVFSNLRIDLPGNGYQLAANASGFPTIASTAFDVIP